VINECLFFCFASKADCASLRFFASHKSFFAAYQHFMNVFEF